MRGGAGGEEALSWATQHKGSLGGRCSTCPPPPNQKRVSREKSSRAGEPQESVATSLTSVTAARQTGRQTEEEKGRQGR